MTARDDIERLPPPETHERRIAELEAELREARRAVQARDDFLAIAAHELRTPMNALGLQIAAIERQARRAGDATLVQQLGRARRSVRQYVGRATLLLDVTRLNAGRVPLQLRRTDLARIVSDVVETHAEEAAFHGAALVARVPGPVVGYWDDRLVEQILANLLSNALKYGGGSPVTVGAERFGPDRARLSVEDRGPGIDASQQRLIFEKFERVVDGTRTHSGFGLGLWIVGQLVEALGGTIAIRSAPGAGCEFVVDLPLEPGPADAPPDGARR